MMAKTNGAAAFPARRIKLKRRKERSEAVDTALFFVRLALLVLVLRSFVFSPFSIPSESMLPRLEIGDYLFVSKWNYGFSRYSLPGNLPILPRLFWHTPERGDVVVFKAPPHQRQDYIKRVIGLPGDTVQMRHGQVILNGVAVPKQRIADFVVPVSPNYGCESQFQDRAAGKPVCRYMRYRETLPNGRSYEVLDRGEMPDRDDTDVYNVPADHLFLMGDNRDDSGDSRFPAQDNGPIGMVPIGNVEGRAWLTFWSTDGSANWLKPWTWFTAARPARMGRGF
jgi:signal peptidase I